MVLHTCTGTTEGCFDYLNAVTQGLHIIFLEKSNYAVNVKQDYVGCSLNEKSTFSPVHISEKIL
jgi:hypothetical protein